MKRFKIAKSRATGNWYLVDNVTQKFSKCIFCSDFETAIRFMDAIGKAFPS